MSVAINEQLLEDSTLVLNSELDWLYPEVQEVDVIPNFNKLEKRQSKVFSAKHATKVIATYVAISDDKLTREQVRRANRKPRKITRKTVEAREFLGIYN